jgi:putative transcriptional regulator
MRGQIRTQLGLPQAEFACAVSPRSLQEWEQGRCRPEGAVRAYLTVIGRDLRRWERPSPASNDDLEQKTG